MKTLLALLLVVLATPAAQAGAPVTNTILTDRTPPYLVPLSGATVPVGGSETATVTLNKGLGDSQLTLLTLLPGSEFQITGGTCAVGTTFIAPTDSCTINVQFSPTVPGAGVGTLQVDCAPYVPAGGVTITCDTSPTSIFTIALNGFAAIVASVPVPALGRYEITALALLLFAMAGWSLRRKG